MKVKIENKRCIGAAVCTEVCGFVFQLGEDGKSQLSDRYQGSTPVEGEVPDEIECVQTAKKYCPAGAITVEKNEEDWKPDWWQRFWVKSAIIALIFAVTDYIAYHFHFIDMQQLLRTPLYILGGIGIYYMVNHIITEVLPAEKLLKMRRIACILMGTFFLGFLIWIALIMFLPPFTVPVWWYGLLATLLPSYGIGALLGYGLSKIVHVNRAAYILMGMFGGFFGMAFAAFILMQFPSLEHRGIRLLILVGFPILGGFLGDWIGKRRNYYLPGSLVYKPKAKTSKRKN